MKNTFSDPMKTTFQCEYEMLRQISSLFHSVLFRSNAVRTLKLYHRENHDSSLSGKIKTLLERDVYPNILFPDAKDCKVYLRSVLLPDRSHLFVLSDGIYSFAVHLIMNRSGKELGRIEFRSWMEI